MNDNTVICMMLHKEILEFLFASLILYKNEKEKNLCWQIMKLVK